MQGEEHWASNGSAKLFLWRKRNPDGAKPKGTILFVHGSSMASTPTFDLAVPGRAHSSAMEYFAGCGFDTWCFDMQGYGRSTKDRSHNSDIATGAGDCAAAAAHIRAVAGNPKLMLYGISSGALRAALFAQNHPEWVERLALDAFVYTGKGSPTLAERTKRLPQFLASPTRPIDRAFVQSIFDRDHPGTAEQKVIDSFADAILALDSEMPTGTYVDMCSKLPVVDPRRIAAPTLIMRGEYDGIAAVQDLLEFFAALPNANKAFAVMPGIAHASFQQKNYLFAYHTLLSFFTQPPLVYPGA
jgi:pimeloyl-ACP methyl ester carboxylesterase